MAYAALVSLAQTTYQILNDNEYHPISVIANQEIRSICDDAIFLLEFLEEFQEKATSFEGRIAEAANKAEDTVEFFVSGKVRSDCGSTKSAVVGVSKVKFISQMRKAAEKMKSIVGEVKEIETSVTVKDAQRLTDSPAASLSSRFEPSENVMVGRDQDLMVIMDRLIGDDNWLYTQAIVGMGGIGKTILARNVYEHPLIISYFHVRAWITVSQNYSVEEILSSLLVSMGVPAEKISGQRGDLADEVHKRLVGRRHLVVMDDVWSTKVWNDIRMVFPKDGSDTRILFTTRLRGVADYLHSYLGPHEMRLMDADQSWNLLRQKVFIDEACPDELEDVGKEIARSCRGLPLSIVIIAELLSGISKTRASWEAIAKNVISALATKDGPFEKMLVVSYTQLPHHLRSCLLYMAGFPKDYEFRVSELIKLWIAENFVKPNGYKTFEEVAESYLRDLVDRNLVLVTTTKYNGEIKSCSLHDVVRDFCVRKVQEEKFFLPVKDYLPTTTLRRYFLPRILKNQRRICVTSYDLNLRETIYNSPIRTIICIQQRGYRSKGSVQNYRLLRVLHVVHKNEDWNWEPGQVFELIQLRYLASNIPFLSNPLGISKLKNLQTLVIYRHDVRLPVEIWMLPQLRHLIAFSFRPLPYPEGATFPLRKLQTLSLATDFVCSERILEMIPNLQKLGICYSEDRFDRDYHLDNLQQLHRLKKLKLEICGDFPLGQNLNPVFPMLLKKLNLSGCQLPWGEMRIVGSLPNLEVLKLRDFAFRGCEWETTEGGFDQLRFLLIDGSDLQQWISEGIHFPRLESLRLHRCSNLSEIPSSFGYILTLEMIEVGDRNRSLVESAKRIQEKQLYLGNYAFQVRYSNAQSL